MEKMTDILEICCNFLYNIKETDIITICVPLIIGIFTIAYPIILEQISKIGVKYNSKYLLVLFYNEHYQKKRRFFKSNIFQISLISTLASLFFHITKFQPLFGWNNCIINNSAKIITILLTVILIIIFLNWLNEVRRYITNIYDLLNYIIEKYEKTKDNEIKRIALMSINEFVIYSINTKDKELQKKLLNFYEEHFNDNDEIKKIALMTINDIAIYAINTKDVDLQIKLLKFYTDYVIKFRNNSKENTVTYDNEFYNLVSSLVDECVEKNHKHLLPLRHSAINGSLLIPNDFQQIKISKETYKWLWYNVTLIRHNYNFVAEFWKNSSQYFRFELEQIYPNPQWDENNEIIDTNKDISEQREKEQNRFLEFHYAFGGLMLYSKNYEALNYMFIFSQSQPPKYELLPYTMTDIFEWFEWFYNENNHLGNFIGLVKYPFPEIDNLGNRPYVVFQICKYICILFLRQFSIPETLYYRNPTKQPNLPQELKKLYNWQKSLEYFRFCLNKVLEDKEILQRLNLQQIFVEKESEINIFLEELEESIRTIIQNEKKNAEISKSKELQFYKSSSKILGDGFKQYENIRNKEGFDNTDKDVKTFIRGSQTLSPKSSFTDGDTPCVDCDSVFAHGIVQWNLKKYIPNAFLMARTQSYLLSKDDLIKGINKIVDKKENVCIIAFNLGNEIIQSIKQSKYKDKVIYLPSTDLRNLIFILEEKDLPKFTFKNVSGKEKQKFHLKGINKKYKIYASIIDINLPKNEKLKNIYANNLDKDNLQVLETLSFITEIRFRADRKIIQIKVNSVYEESGSVNSLDDLKPL
ncbi:MAG: hypothetical protein Q4A09_05150 [Capnocytophaga felis]|nr:hypothetical protein [Capnocytophaga felis]